MKVNINYLKDHSIEFSQLSPFFIFSDVFEFQGYKFKNVYTFLEALKISDLDKRKEFLDYYLDTKNLHKLFILKNDKLSYTTKFNKQSIDSINFNNSEISVNSLELKTLLQNLFISIASKNAAFKYSILSTKSKDISIDELDTHTLLGYVSSDYLVSLLKSI